LVDGEIISAESDGRDVTIETVWKFFGRVEEAIRVTRVEKHRAVTGMLDQREHGGEADARPRAAANGDVFGAGAVTCVEDGDANHFLTQRHKGRTTIQFSIAQILNANAANERMTQIASISFAKFAYLRN